MKKGLFSIFFLVLIYHSHAQTTVYRKIAQRHDDYISSNWKGVDSILFDYNSDARLINQTALKGNATNGWDNFSKYSFYLNPAGKVNVQVRENWNGSAWVYATKYTNTYDASSNLTLIEYHTWDGSNWIPNAKTEYTGYNAFGNWNQQITYNYIGGTWVYAFRGTQQFINPTAFLQTKESESWDNNLQQWNKIERLSYTYYQDSIGSITRSTPSPNNTWVSNAQYLYTYFSIPFRLQTYTTKLWNQDSLNFLNDSRTNYTYNAAANYDQIISEDYIGASNWSPIKRTQHLYNPSNQLIEKYSEENIGGWQNKDRNTYTYSSNFVNEDLYYVGSASNWNLSKKTNYNYDVNDNLIFKQQEDYNGINYTPSSRDFYYYNSFVVGLYETESMDASTVLFPNPCNDRLHIQLESDKETAIQINIVDMLGRNRILISSPIRKGKNIIDIETNTLATGNYFVQLSDMNTHKKQVSKIQILR